MRQNQSSMTSRCLKITEKVSFSIESEASYVYILSGQKLIKNAKNGAFWRVFENLKLARSNSVTRQVTFNRTKIGGKCLNWKIQMRHFGWFSNYVRWHKLTQKDLKKNINTILTDWKNWFPKRVCLTCFLNKKKVYDPEIHLSTTFLNFNQLLKSNKLAIKINVHNKLQKNFFWVN